jgi:hypothetical protein
MIDVDDVAARELAINSANVQRVSGVAESVSEGGGADGACAEAEVGSVERICVVLGRIH